MRGRRAGARRRRGPSEDGLEERDLPVLDGALRELEGPQAGRLEQRDAAPSRPPPQMMWRGVEDEVRCPPR